MHGLENSYVLCGSAQEHDPADISMRPFQTQISYRSVLYTDVTNYEHTNEGHCQGPWTYPLLPFPRFFGIILMWETKRASVF